jgi:2-polyprenyl-3-methyl-5-hydroxy-6-metoxy-1,4-benzoquinol methylase
MARADYPVGVPANAYVQLDQPPGVPPLALTGERTLPNVPAENYWYRRHLVVYDWIAERVGGAAVIDMASGEGYGADVLARRAGSVLGLDANPEAYEHARLRYTRANLSFDRGLVETYGEPASYDVVSFLQTIEHVQNPEEVLGHFRGLLKPSGTAYISTPNLLTLAPPGAEKSENPWHIKEYRAQEFRALLQSAFGSVELYGVFHARKLRWHAVALKLGWDKVHKRLGVTGLFYDRFTPAIATSDFRIAPENLDAALDFLAVCRA